MDAWLDRPLFSDLQGRSRRELIAEGRADIVLKRLASAAQLRSILGERGRETIEGPLHSAEEVIAHLREKINNPCCATSEQVSVSNGGTAEPTEPVKLGTLLHAIGREAGMTDAEATGLEEPRDKTPAKPWQPES